MNSAVLFAIHSFRSPEQLRRLLLLELSLALRLAIERSDTSLQRFCKTMREPYMLELGPRKPAYRWPQGSFRAGESDWWTPQASSRGGTSSATEAFQSGPNKPVPSKTQNHESKIP